MLIKEVLVVHRVLASEAGDCLTELEADRALIHETIQKLTAEGSDGKSLIVSSELLITYTNEDTHI